MQSGFVEGQNVKIEYRSAEGQFDRIPALIADLVRRQPSLLMLASPTAVAVFPGNQGTSRRARCALPDSGTLRMARIRHCRWLDEL